MSTPARLRAAAGGMRTLASRLPGLLEPTVRITRYARWRGPDATTFRTDLHHHRRRLADTAERLRAEAHRLERRAVALEALAAEGPG